MQAEGRTQEGSKIRFGQDICKDIGQEERTGRDLGKLVGGSSTPATLAKARGGGPLTRIPPGQVDGLMGEWVDGLVG